jgi:hypothetical protein
MRDHDPTGQFLGNLTADVLTGRSVLEVGGTQAVDAHR